MIYKLFLDDVREIHQIYKNADLCEWILIKNYDEFVKCVEKNGLPIFISYDHDLATEHYRESMYASDGHYTKYYTDGTFREKTGYHCAQWLVTYCIDKNIDLPKWKVHSMNPTGKQNIQSLLSSYEEFRSNNSKGSQKSKSA